MNVDRSRRSLLRSHRLKAFKSVAGDMGDSVNLTVNLRNDQEIKLSVLMKAAASVNGNNMLTAVDQRICLTDIIIKRATGQCPATTYF